MAVCMQLVIFFMLTNIFSISAQPLTCGDAYECAYGNVTNTGWILCNGYRSCFSCGVIESFDDFIFCSGSYACYGSVSIHIHNTSYHNAEIECNGLASCANVDSISNNYGTIYCGGELSCFGSTLYVAGNDLNCYGDRSCANATIYLDNSDGFCGIRAHLAAQNSIFYSLDSGIRYYFTGAFSGENATIVCGSNESVDVNY